jgi:hypothetical protein
MKEETMIICTYFGMFMPALRPAKSIPPGDNRVIQVRSRRKIDLDRLRALYMPDLGETIRLPNTDYQYRAYCTRRDLADALALIAMDIDYLKFKDTPKQKLKDYALTNAYNKIWHAALDAFPEGSIYGRWTRPAAPTRNTANGGTWGNAPRSLLTETTTRRVHWWEDVELVPDREPTDAELRAIEVSGFDTEGSHVGPVVQNGRVNHTYCDHAPSKNARERCRRRLRKAGKL